MASEAAMRAAAAIKELLEPAEFQPSAEEIAEIIDIEMFESQIPKPKNVDKHDVVTAFEKLAKAADGIWDGADAEKFVKNLRAE